MAWQVLDGVASVGWRGKCWMVWQVLDDVASVGWRGKCQPRASATSAWTEKKVILHGELPLYGAHKKQRNMLSVL